MFYLKGPARWASAKQQYRIVEVVKSPKSKTENWLSHNIVL